MEKSKGLTMKYGKLQEIRLQKIHEAILADALTNPLLQRHIELPEYFKDWIDGSRLVAVLPALPLDDAKCQSYYSVGSLKNGDGPQTIRLSPVYMYENLPEQFQDPTKKIDYTKRNYFIFDSEYAGLYSYEKKKHSQQYHYVRAANFDEYKKYLDEHPVVLFFYGCDDGHVGKRFKTREDAFEYLQCITVFEDVFGDSDLQRHN